jgi:methyltransferase (TIGR00027 family)
MHEGRPSATAQRVVAYRLDFDRPPAPFGDATADERLARDVVGSSAPFERSEAMARYLRGRTTFFDRVVVNALDRDIGQVVTIGAGYDGRSLRYAKPGVRWFEVDHPDTQRDKRARLQRLGIEAPLVTFVGIDLTDAGVATALVGHGYQPEAPSQFICEGVAVYLDQPVLESLLGELRSVATVGTRLAISWPMESRSEQQVARRERFVAAVGAMGEPARNAVTSEWATELLATARWRGVEISERAQRAGFVVAVPDWVPSSKGAPTTSAIGSFMERTFHRSGTDRLAGHLESTYNIEIAKVRELDVGVFRVDRGDAGSWIARVFPAIRALDVVRGDVEIIRSLAQAGFPAERCAHAEPVSTLHGQGVVVTEYVPGGHPAASPSTFRKLGELLGQLHTRPTGPGAETRPGGAWHHLVPQGAPGDEIIAALSLLDHAEPRVPPTQQPLYQSLRDELRRADKRAEEIDDLPHALLHPDFVPANVMTSRGGELVLVDWAGVGRGPRLASLGFLLWSTGGSRPCVDAVISGYRPHVRLESDELDRLAAAVMARPVVFGSWSFATGRQRLPDVVDDLPAIRAGADAIAARARLAFTKTT